jgi:DNA processing protein
MNHEAWLRLANARVTAAEYDALRERCGDIDNIVSKSSSHLAGAGLSTDKAAAIANPDAPLLQRCLDWLRDEPHHILCRGEDGYPELLAEIPGAPLMLYVNGDPDALQFPALAIVGSRNPTRGGIRNARDFARHLVGQGFAVVSGLAQGIDAAAHRGALDAGGKTIAVLGTGIDRVYPAGNRDLAHEIAATGAIVSEYPLGAAPQRRHFPERNRLISGLSLGTLVVEAARRSGSLITARLAGDQGREIFALPGSIHNPLSRGCHALIRQGAKLVENAGDILAELQPLVGHMLEATSDTPPTPHLPADVDGDYAALRKVLGHDPATIDELAKDSGLTIEQLSSMLLILELHGEVESLSGGRYVKKESLQA